MIPELCPLWKFTALMRTVGPTWQDYLGRNTSYYSVCYFIWEFSQMDDFLLNFVHRIKVPRGYTIFGILIFTGLLMAMLGQSTMVWSTSQADMTTRLAHTAEMS